jgi:outer membrane receptor protein involved in Fe transport
MSSARAFGWGLILSLLLAPAAAAQTPRPEAEGQPRRPAPAPSSTDQTSDQLPTITTVVTVTAPDAPRRIHPSADVRTLPSSASVLTPRDLQNAPYREPGEVVRPLPGMGFSYYGQGGIPSGPTVRGYTDRNFGQDIAGFLDRIPLNLNGFVASHGALDLTILIPGTLERVELVRGPIEARYGDFNRGGTLNVVTRDGVSRPSITASGGSYAAWNASGEYGNYRAGSGRPAIYSHASTQGTGGYADNQELWHHRLFNRLLVPLRRGDLTFTALNGWSEWGAPGYLDRAAVQRGEVGARHAVNPTDGGRIQHNLFSLRYRAGAGVSRPLEATFYAGSRDWNRWRQDVLLGPTQPQVRQTDERTSWGYRVEQTWGQFVGRRPLLFTVGTALHRADAETGQARTVRREFVAWNDDVDVLMTDAGVYAQGQVGVTDWLKAVTGLRYSRVAYDIGDNIREPGQYVAEYTASKWQPKIGLVFAPWREVELYTNYVVGMRSPTPRTEVRNSIGSIDRVEIAETGSYELGATIRPLPRVDIDATGWRAYNSNEIRGIPPGGVQFESLGRSRRHGASVDLAWWLLSETRISAGASWMNARLLTPATPGATHLPDIPEYVHQIGIQSPLGPTRALARFHAAFQLSLYGRKHLNTLGTIRSDSYQRGTFRVSYAPAARYRAWVGGFFYPGSKFGESEYLFGSRVGVRPNPPMSLDAGLSVTF